MSEKLFKKESRFSAQTDQLVNARSFVTEALKQTLMSDKDARQVVLAVDEAISNAIVHAVSSQKERVICLEVVSDGKALSITILHQGPRFDTAAEVGRRGVDIDEHVMNGEKRGLGLHILGKVMDEIRYDFQEEDQGNKLVLVKYIVDNS